ncbi:hypothetical protein TWF225_005753 [Orbilia oligospora]|uniref:Uncharacterized protein n=1 Tax=Orbilia oligospora TaxID=2813651 RepID=A0A8H2E8L9_ORBOL|nr:hypothetical protein TWF225_005753 [Orbilia oligospora]KAF3271322.1 hypothetical protein TWF217_005720 [Orbilia oligospora]KAF3271880.1 hypothetical protein TWF128_000406 [Orbilia oligospora]KAF3293541.1 hypothetical protein TWF132_004509 [Orbilia oligospora]TGJ72381.1 hypothetical protein EYR41_004280 [Orbilia oligospora]
MSLESGIYTIKCKLNGNLVGRHLVEDRSGNPKPVYALGAGNEPPQWVVEKCEEGYILSNNGGRAASIDDKLFAILMEEEFDSAETWVIEAQPHQGENLYTVKTKSQSKAWSQTTEVGSEPDTFIIAVDYFTVRESLPVQYLPHNLFEFVSIGDMQD